MLTRRAVLGGLVGTAILAACDPVSAARRLLLLGGGSGASFTKTTELDRWVRQGVVLTAPSWTSVGILEPTVIYVGPGDWRMWFRSGGLHAEGTNPTKVGYATSADGVSWTDSGAPILGNGTGGEAGKIQCPHMRHFGTTWYLYYNDIDTAKFKVGASADGHSGFSLTDTGLTLPTGATIFGHMEPWKEGSTYYALCDAYIAADDYWGVFLATSASPTTGWTWLNSGNQVAGMQVATDGTYGAAFVDPDSPTFSGVYEAWLHASPDSGNVVSNLYRAHSTDRINWTQAGPVLIRSGSAYEIDQVADPCVLEVAGSSYLYYDADEAATGVCVIKLATYAGTLAGVIA